MHRWLADVYEGALDLSVHEITELGEKSLAMPTIVHPNFFAKRNWYS